MSLATASRVSDWANAALLLSLAVGALSTFLVVKTAGVKERYWDTARETAAERIATAEEHSAKLAVELEQAKNNAKQIDANLLNEQRLTANERWRLNRIERAVLPRSNFVDWAKLVAELRAGHFARLNIAVPDRPVDAYEFGQTMVQAFADAGLLKGVFNLPHSESRLVPARASGVLILKASESADRLGEMIRQDFHQFWGPDNFRDLPPEWETIPQDADCLLILENNAAALNGGDGQAGEGKDANGRPVPAP